MKPTRTITAAILAGGLGSRLRPVLCNRPKVLAEVAGRPFVTYLLDRLVTAGVREAILLTGHLGEQVEAELGDRYRELRLRYSHEESPLGTGGAVRAALPLVTTPQLLLLNGDSYCDFDVDPFVKFHQARRTGVSLVLAPVADTGRYGRVRVGAFEQVVGFDEKQADGGPGWINAGVYLLDREVLDDIRADGPVSLEREVMPGWVARGLVHGYRQKGRFLDIGTPESYACAEALFSDRWAFAH